MSDTNLALGDGKKFHRRKTLDIMSYINAKDELEKREHHTERVITQLAAFVPDFILLSKSTDQIRDKLSCIAFMADVSGFTALTEAYSLKNNGGTDQLTKTLSSYMGPLAECILLAGGDIIKYAGDAFLAVWKVEESATISKYSILQKATDCALYIQEKYGTYDTDIGIKIRVKIGIGAGDMYQVSLNSQNSDYRHYVCFGAGVKAASEAENKCVPGDVIMSPSAWGICNSSDFIFTLKEDGFVKIVDILEFHKSDQRGRPLKGTKGPTRTATESSIRHSVHTAVERNLEDALRAYVIPPVLKKIDDDVPLEYLNESRQTSVCFIKVDYRHNQSGSQSMDTTTNLVRDCFQQIYKSTSITNGCLSKVIMFDKGLTYLIVFGLPGYIHDNQSANALKFSYKVKTILHEVHEYITEVSIGVTSGTVYCGILGHKQRREYTVIGRIVNKAARLMCNYPNRVTCDQDTLYHAKLPVNQFSLMESKELKGIRNAGNIYEFVGAEVGEDQGIKHYDYPLLNREVEFQLFLQLLEATETECTKFLRTHRVVGADVEYAFNKDVLSSGIWILVIEGDIGIGKSRLLSSFMDEAEKKGAQVFSITMSLISGSQSLFAIRSLLYQALSLEELRSSSEREDYLRKLAGNDPELHSGLCLLNDVLNVKFPIHPRYVDADIVTRRSYAEHIASVLVRIAYPKSLILFFVDDAHYMDNYSWDFLIYLSRTPTIFSVASIRRNPNGLPKLSDSINSYIYHHKHVKPFKLQGLSPELLLPLACQLAEVNAVPSDVLDKITKSKSSGNPAFIEEVLNEWIRTGRLRTLPFDLREASRRRLQMAILEQKEFITKLKMKGRTRALTDANTSGNMISQAQRLKKEVINAEARMIVVKSDTNIASWKTLSGSIKEVLLDAFDELDEKQQMIIKCASTLGIRFSRKMISTVLPNYENNIEKYESSFKKLMSSQIIQCASIPSKDARLTITNDSSEIQCFCTFSAIELEDFKQKEIALFQQAKGKETTFRSIVQALNVQERTTFQNCKFLKFTKENLQEVVYELLTEEIRKEFHIKAAKYLEKASGKCSIHGGEDTTYAFGFITKGNDITADQDEALLTLNSQANRRNTMMEDMESKSKDTEFHHSTMEMSRSRIGIGGNSKQNAYNKIRDIFKQSGARIGGMELEIFEELEKFESSQQKSGWFGGICSCTGSEIKQEKEYDLKLMEFRNAKDTDVTSVKDTTSRMTCGDDKLESCSDLRGCFCVQVHTRLSAELVRHYQKAEKYGKCLIHLLDAAESATTVGQVSQTIVHLEDADALLRALQNNELPKPNKNDPDDWVVNIKEVDMQLDFLRGLSYFELGVQSKALEFFSKFASNFGIVLPTEKVARNAVINRVKAQLWRRHHCPCHISKTKNKLETQHLVMLFRVLNYLRTLFQNSGKPEMALLVCLQYARIAEDSGTFDDTLGAFSAVMESFSYLGHHKQARAYEKLAIKYVRKKFVSVNEKDLIGLHTSANLFVTVAFMRLWRGDLSRGIDASYIALRISQDILHNNQTTIILYPRLIFGLTMALRISEVIDAMRKYWYAAEEEEDWGSFAKYYVLALALILNTTFCIEQFYTIESFVNNSDWDGDIQMFRLFDGQYNIESGIALRYIRHKKWSIGIKWMTKADTRRTKLVPTLMTVDGDLKLLEATLVLSSHYIKGKLYQLAAKYREKAKSYIRLVEKGVEFLPLFKARQQHLMGYYYQIQSRNSESKKCLKKAEKFAKKHGNLMELEWIAHSRAVWSDSVVPIIRNFWIEHTERNTLDWHEANRIEIKNVMYSLPLPTWK